MSFAVKNRSWDENCPKITQPNVIGYYSVDAERKLSLDISQLNYLVYRNERKVRFDLKKGYNRRIQKCVEPVHEKLEHFLKWISLNAGQMKNKENGENWLQADFVCYRGLLTKLWSTPYERRFGWIICAAKFQGTIYLCAFETEQDKYEQLHRNQMQKQCMAWGFKFEQYMVSPDPSKNLDTSQGVNENEEFGAVFRTNFADHNLLYAGEMDGVVSVDGKKLEEPVDWRNVEFVELKTSAAPKHVNQQRNFNQKIMKWWCQSFLVGIDKVYCGFRDNEGIVHEVKLYSVRDLKKMGEHLWKPSQAMNFCNEFLSHVKNVVQKEYNQCIYKFSWNVDDNVKVEEMKPISEFSFLPDWFTTAMNES